VVSELILLNEWFVTAETKDWILATSLDHEHDISTVIFSVFIVMLGAYSAICLSETASRSQNKVTRNLWLATASLPIGGGIWAMHFLGMLAIDLPVQVRYDMTLTALSAAIAVVFSGGSLFLATSSRRSWIRALGAGASLGIGVWLAHFTGMAATYADVSVRFAPMESAFSLLLAVFLCSLAIACILYRPKILGSRRWMHRFLGSCFLGAAVAAADYTAEHATSYLPWGRASVAKEYIDPTVIGILIGSLSVSLISLLIVSSMLAQARRIRRLEADMNEQTLNAIFNHVADAVITIDTRGMIQEFNPAAERMFGYSKGEVIDRDVALLATPEHRVEHSHYLSNADPHLQRVIGQTRPLKGQRKGGETFDIEINLSAMGAEGKKRYIGVCSDVSMRKRVEAALRDAKEKSDAANLAKSEFLAKMSHELRTPLNAVLGFSELIKNQVMGPLGSQKYGEYAADLGDAGRHLLALVNDILDLSKIEAGEARLNPEEIYVEEEVRAAPSLVKIRAQAGGVNVEIKEPAHPPQLYADRRMFKQILTNLLSNAIKFTDEGGKVTLKYWNNGDNGYVFEVSDTGVGLAPEDIPKAFAPFSQVDNRLNRKHEGTGIGLPLTKSIVELHGGTLELESELGAGTTVTVTFPKTSVRPVLAGHMAKSA
jgi:PAS domain S-box-containing protein